MSRISTTATQVYVPPQTAERVIASGGILAGRYISASQASELQKQGGMLNGQYIAPGQLDKGCYIKTSKL